MAYKTIEEPHARGALLVSAVFAAFTRVYDRKTRDLFRLATNGTGVLPPGEIPFDLVERLAVEAADVAGTILTTCIRALDYCPPVDLTFGEYLRALITADRDLIPDDKDGYRIAFIAAFRERGIYPSGVSNLSVDALVWQCPDVPAAALAPIASANARIDWRRKSDRFQVFVNWNKTAKALYDTILDNPATPADFYAALGLVQVPKDTRSIATTIDGKSGRVSRIEIGAVRPAWRVAPNGDILSDLIIEMTQKWMPEDEPGQSFRGGCTLICDLDTAAVRYVIRKRVGHNVRTSEEASFRGALADSEGGPAYFTGAQAGAEPFAMLHRGT
jgi:hypothetical protein